MKKKFTRGAIAVIFINSIFFMDCVFAQNVGVGVASPAEKLEVAGNVKGADFIYAVPKTFRYTLSGADFSAGKSTDTVLFNVGSGGVTMVNGIAGKRVIAPLHLPDGAAMVKMTAYMYDYSSTDNLDVILYRKTITSNFFPENIGIVASAATSPGTNPYETDLSSFSSVVDNSSYTYFIDVEPQNFNSVWVGNMELSAIVIEYTLATTQ